MISQTLLSKKSILGVYDVLIYLEDMTILEEHEIQNPGPILLRLCRRSEGLQPLSCLLASSTFLKRLLGTILKCGQHMSEFHGKDKLGGRAGPQGLERF